MTIFWTGYQTVSDLGQSDPPVRLVPYYAWANRAAGPMVVWLRRAAAEKREEGLRRTCN